MRPGPVHHIAVKVRDLGRSEAFYAGVLGLPVLRRHDDDEGNPRSVWLDLGGAILMIELTAEEKEVSPHGWHCVALSIDPDDRERWRARLVSAGSPMIRETDFTIYAHDPDGALVALSHYPATLARSGNT